MDNAIEAIGVAKRYGEVPALVSVDFDVAPGEIHALIGLNGAGKSTLMKVMTGMVEPQSGCVRVLGAEVGNARSTRWQGVGHLIESPLAYPELTVAENLGLAAALHLVPKRTATAQIDGLIKLLDLQSLHDRRADRLSMGNRQRLAIGCALVGRPDALILDEPTSALDPHGVILIRHALQEAKSRGCGILVSSHHLDEVSRLADRITVIHRGEIVGVLEPGGAELERAFFEMVYAHDAARTGPEVVA